MMGIMLIYQKLLVVVEIEKFGLGVLGLKEHPITVVKLHVSCV